jgi:hypothetical protein
MADFYAPQFQPPADVLGAYIRGRYTIPNEIALQQQQVQAGQLNLDQVRLAMQMKQQQAAQLAQLYGGQADQAPAGSAPAGAQAGGGPTGGIQQGPQADVGQSPPQAGGSPLDHLMSPDRLARLAQIGSLNAAYKGEDPIRPFADAQKAAAESRDSQIRTAQLQMQMSGSPLSMMNTFAANPNAGDAMLQNPQLIPHWTEVATKYGRDPKDLSNENVRITAALAARDLAASVGLPPPAMPELYSKPTKGPDGSLLQTDLGSNKTTAVVGREPAGILGAAALTTDAKERAYQTYVATGQMPQGMGRSPAMQASLLNYIAQRANQDGNSAAAAAAQGQFYKASQGVVKGFESGAESKQINSINTAVKHMDVLAPLAESLNNTSSPAFNKAANFFKQQTGSAAPTSYAAIKEFVSGEVAKAVLPGGGGEAERQALQAPLNAANSPEQLRNAIKQIQSALAGKTDALRQQWEAGTNGTQGSFDKFLLPETKKALGIQSAPSGGTVTLYKNGIPHNIPADKADDARKNYGYQDKP